MSVPKLRLALWTIVVVRKRPNPSGRATNHRVSGIAGASPRLRACLMSKSLLLGEVGSAGRDLVRVMDGCRRHRRRSDRIPNVADIGLIGAAHCPSPMTERVRLRRADGRPGATRHGSTGCPRW
jgi:hypothetical protein